MRATCPPPFPTHHPLVVNSLFSGVYKSWSCPSCSFFLQPP
jgi:hypothetical protein